MTRENYPVEIGDHVFWIGSLRDGILRNGYLIVDGEEGILVDPGSIDDFGEIAAKVSPIIRLNRITYVVLHGCDADCCSSVAALEKAGVKARIVSQQRIVQSVRSLGAGSAPYVISEMEFALRLESGRVLQFLCAPYLPSVDSFVTYDPKTRILFSGELFSSEAGADALWDFSADATGAYHARIFSSTGMHRSLIDRLRIMDIVTIAPRRGPLVREGIAECIARLREIECGADAVPVPKKLGRDGTYESICDGIMHRYQAMYSRQELVDVFAGTMLPYGGNGLAFDRMRNADHEILETMFRIIVEKRGLSWLVPVEDLVTRAVREYGIAYPSAFKPLIVASARKAGLPKHSHDLLAEEVGTFGEQISEAEKNLAYNNLTGLRNDLFFRSFLAAEVKSAADGGKDFSVIFLSVDNLAVINNKLGKKTGDEILVHLTYLLKNFLASDSGCGKCMLFKAEGPWFALFAPDMSIEQGAEIADRIRLSVAQSSIFIAHVTVSSGVVSLSEFRNPDATAEAVAATIHDAGMMKGRIAQKRGPGSIYYKVDENDFAPLENFVLIVDSDTMNLGILKKELADLGIQSLTCEDGSAALAVIEKRDPQVIISELMLPKIDAFRIKEYLNRSLYTKSIPFILLSHDKNERLVAQSLSLGITYFFKKPCISSEIAGIAKNLLERID